MRTLLLLLTIIGLPNCKKDKCICHKPTLKYGQIVTADRFVLYQYHNNAFDPKNPYRTLTTIVFQKYGWWNRGDSIYWALQNIDYLSQGVEPNYPAFKIMYVGERNFIDSNNTPTLDFQDMTSFLIDSSLAGKPVFEIYDTKDNRLYLRIIASKKAQIAVWDWNCPTTKELANTYNLYIEKAKTDIQAYSSMACRTLL